MRVFDYKKNHSPLYNSGWTPLLYKLDCDFLYNHLFFTRIADSSLCHAHTPGTI